MCSQGGGACRHGAKAGGVKTINVCFCACIAILCICVVEEGLWSICGSWRNKKRKKILRRHWKTTPHISYGSSHFRCPVAGRNKRKRPERFQSVRLSKTKRLGWEAGDLVRDATQLWKCPWSYPNSILYYHNMRQCENASLSFLAVLASLTKSPASQPNLLIQLTGLFMSLLVFFSFFDPPPDTEVRFTIRKKGHFCTG